MELARSELTIEQKKAITTELLKKYPNKIPIYCVKGPSTQLPKLSKDKFLIDSYLTLGYLMAYIRAQLKLKTRESVVLQIKNKEIASTLKAVYQEYADEDGFLYIYYSSEDIYGGI